jgi:hypothetical protein
VVTVAAELKRAARSILISIAADGTSVGDELLKVRGGLQDVDHVRVAIAPRDVHMDNCRAGITDDTAQARVIREKQRVRLSPTHPAGMSGAVREVCGVQ